jgi:basic amino acid/polyamine antiporter, APA family
VHVAFRPADVASILVPSAKLIVQWRDIMHDKALDAPVSLARTLTPLQLFAIAFGSIVGIGWITLVGGWIAKAGPLGAIAGFALGCAAVLLIALTYAELALLLPRAGAEVTYADVAFGKAMAFAVGWVLLLVYAAVIGFEMISVGWVCGVILPQGRGPVLWELGGRATHAGELIVGVGTMLALAAANLRAAGTVARGQLALIVVKVGVSLVFILTAFAHGDAHHLAPAFVDDFSKVPAGVLSVFAVSLLFFGGFNFLPQAIEERSREVAPVQIVRAMIASLVFAFLFYALVILATALVLPREAIEGLDLPAAAAFEIAFGSRLLRNLVLVAGLLGLITAWNGTLFAASRIVLMLARQQLLPAVFGTVSDTGRTPVAAVLAVSAAGTMLGLCGRAAVEPIVIVAATCIPLTWTIVAAAAIRLRFKMPHAVRPFCVRNGLKVFATALAFALLAFVVALAGAVGSGQQVAIGALALGGWAGLGVLVWLCR